MIIIDEHVETKMMQHLERLRSSDVQGRCLRFSLSALLPAARVQEVSDFAALHDSKDDMAFFMPDGDVYLFSHHLAPKLIRPTIAELHSRLGYVVCDLLADLMDVQASWLQLYSLVRQRVRAIENAKAVMLQNAEKQQRDQTRHSIIQTPIDVGLISSLTQRRDKHEHPVILLVEDEIFSSKLVEGILSPSYEVHSAYDGQSAILGFARHAPDITFLDIDLPDISGHDVLRRIHEMDRSAYVVMLSGNADRQHISQAISEGASGFIGKPFTREKLRQYIENSPIIKNQRTGART